MGKKTEADTCELTENTSNIYISTSSDALGWKCTGGCDKVVIRQMKRQEGRAASGTLPWIEKMSVNSKEPERKNTATAAAAGDVWLVWSSGWSRRNLALSCIISGRHKCANASSGRKMGAVKFIALLLYLTFQWLQIYSIMIRKVTKSFIEN